ncbi:TRAP transporter small permease subunit [Ruegeria sp. SCP11]|uniref:TRAP transporter small permease subunit n=1 Tax=Ruegeria sp. SCP11 TaxID=3141378 RepID=UPI00333A46F3
MNHNVPQGDGVLLKCSHAYSHLEDFLNVVAALTIFAVMLATTGQIFARLAGYPVPGFLEVSEQAIAVFAFLGAAYAQRHDAHIRMEILVGSLRGRSRWLVEALATLVGMIVMVILVRYSWDFFLSAWKTGDTTYDYGIPTWPSKLLVPFAFSVWFVRLALEFIGFLRLAIWPNAEPVAVPIVRSAAEVAQDEIAETFGDEAGK